MLVIDMKNFNNWSTGLDGTNLTPITHFVWKTLKYSNISGVWCTAKHKHSRNSDPSISSWRYKCPALRLLCLQPAVRCSCCGRGQRTVWVWLHNTLPSYSCSHKGWDPTGKSDLFAVVPDADFSNILVRKHQTTRNGNCQCLIRQFSKISFSLVGKYLMCISRSIATWCAWMSTETMQLTIWKSSSKLISKYIGRWSFQCIFSDR